MRHIYSILYGGLSSRAENGNDLAISTGGNIDILFVS